MRKEALELPRDTGHQLIFYRRNADSSKQTKRTVDRKCNRTFTTSGFKAEAVNEEGVWGNCTVEEVSNDRLRICFV